ncbi:hypothetical protein [Legionella cardiaca]|uniref:Substrate of the Dot/Icm secretion system n=1 Tax=Legionella cardiaca TaxID=1071983 RepID=A0ABY8ARA8_9GAMM|nr:hypothetical protein [Legionella cardiaca]WED43217.1 hypothetical protein PXX05_00125 [Legionella cardiaca]
MKRKDEAQEKRKAEAEVTPIEVDGAPAAAAGGGGAAAPNFGQVQELAEEAMRFLMLRDEQSYLTAIYNLAQECANQINNHGQRASVVVKNIENSMNGAYELNLARVNGLVQFYQRQRAELDRNTLFGMAQDDRLVATIDSLHKYRRTPCSEIIEAVVTDTMVRATRDHGAPLDIDIMSYKP